MQCCWLTLPYTSPPYCAQKSLTADVQYSDAARKLTQMFNLYQNLCTLKNTSQPPPFFSLVKIAVTYGS